MPARFEPQDLIHQTIGLGQASVKKQGETMISKAFAIIADQLAGREWASGDRFGVADAALFYVERWASETSVPLPPSVDAHLRRIKQRPAVVRVMAIWGEQ